jgi:hypothetical protein
MLNKLTGWSKVAAFLLAAALFAGAGSPLWAGGDEAADKDVCKRALERCLADAGKSGLFASWLAAVTTVSSCLAGYDFCRKYVHLLAGEMI